MKSKLPALHSSSFKAMILTFCALLFCVLSQAQTTRYVSTSGSNTTGDGTSGKPYQTISFAVSKSSKLVVDIVKVLPGTYNEQVIIDRSITLDGQDSSRCIVTFSGTATGVLSIFTVKAQNVTIKNFQINADLTKINSAIMNSGSATNLLITGNKILSNLSTPATFLGTYGNRNGISLSSGSNIVITSNTVDSRNSGTFRAAIQAVGIIGLQIASNNFLASVNHDALIKSYSGTTILTNNNFDGGGVEVSNSSGTATGSFTVSNNTFDGTYAHTIPTAMVRIFTNADPLMTVNFSYNHFINQKWTVSFENTRNVTLDNNDFMAVYDSFRLISVNTKLRQSAVPDPLETIDIKLTNNTLSAAPGLTTGNGLEFLNFDERTGANSDKYLQGNYVIGTLGNENNFNANIPTFVYVSNLNGYDTYDPIFLNLYPEYKDVQTDTHTAYWARDIFARYNRYYVNGSLKLASDFSVADFNAVYQKIFDRMDDVNVGSVVLMPTWCGASGTDWSNANNWSYQFTPAKGLDAVVYPQTTNQPILTADAECDTLIVYNGMTLNTNGHNLTLYGNVRSNGTIDGNIIFAGTTQQTLSGTMRIKNFTLNNPAGITIQPGAGNQVTLTGTYTPGNSGVLVTNDNLVLNSDSSGTAIIGKGTGNYISGNVTYERFINTGTAGGQHGKSWQFLSAPVSGQTIKQSWMENGANTPGYGIQVTSPGGTAAGFDMYSVAPSVKYYNYLNNSWVGIANTDALVNSSLGYLVFVRGDRTVTSSGQTATETTLRAKGALSLGTLPAINVTPDQFQSIGNPYASPIDFTALTMSATVDNKFYVWDPYLYGSYGVGGYQVLSSVNDWEPVPGGTSAYPSGTPNSIIQSGQAFFVHATSTGNQSRAFDATPSAITFTEDAKATGGGSLNVTRMAKKTLRVPSQALRVSLFTGPNSTDLMADGNSTVFGQNYSDKYDGNDALKIANSGENFGIKNNGKLLSIDARAPLTDADTVYYNMTNLSKRNYQLRFAPQNLQSTGLQAFLIDNYLNTESPISLSDSSFIDVSVTSAAASSAAGRFKVVFRQMNALPIKVTAVTATAKNSGNLIEWNVENESGIQQYQVEKSTDGSHFNQMAVVNAKNNGSGKYNSSDANVASGINYYRIMIVTIDGKISYTQIVKVANTALTGSVTVFPNPITDGTIHLQLNNQPSGIYKIKVYNSAGQVLLSKNINHIDGSSKETLDGGSLPTGIYQLEVNNPDDSNEVIKIIK